MVKLIEELSFNALPALQTLKYDGWIIRLSKGYTKRANSVNPLYPSTIAVDEKIKKCEEIFYTNNLPVIFKLTSEEFQKDLDMLLQEMGYAYIEPTSVRIIDLKKVPAPKLNSIMIYTTLEDRWLKDYCRLNNINYEHMETLYLMLQSIKMDKFFVSLFEKDKVIACGLGVLENGYIGVFDVIVDKSFREMGYGQQLILNLLELGRKHGATHSYLQVLLRNLPAMHLYSKLGYKEKYKYWYRVKT